ncbi:hypothetical protein BMT54_07385 [Pasteurellaceae bacterium 15-036681]|nr:hypothetical protein BMT54_07385 [Pasteurellaceae bacterium 15-036681]
MKRNITEIIATFSNESKDFPHRYHSFDMCYSHFRHSKESGNIDIEKSCFVLWSYLASWGMLRGSSFLLSKNPAYLKELVEWIYAEPESTWQIDVQDYDTKYEKVLELYEQAKTKLLNGNNHQAVTLVTKVLLGVFAIVPAYDRFFKDTFSELAGNECGFSIPNKKSLLFIHKFYQENKSEIDTLNQDPKLRSVDFNNKATKYHYSKAKIIDMYGFQVGKVKVNLKKRHSEDNARTK